MRGRMRTQDIFAIKMSARPHVITVSDGEPSQKDTKMKLLYVLATILALTLAEEEKKNVEVIEDSEMAAASTELLKVGVDLKPEASSYPYVPPSQRPPQWQTPQNTWQPPKQPAQPVNTWVEPAHNHGNNVQNDYYWSSSTPNYHHPTTTTPIPVIKNEHYIGDHGDYRYEYQIADGTHVGEQGWFSSPKQDEDSLVKRGFYSYIGADGKTYTVTWWADKTGYHAYGAHLPVPPAPAPVQPSYDNKPQHDYPAQTPAPQPAHPVNPTYVPTQPPTYAPPQPQVPAYKPQQPTYNPPTQHYPPQQTYYPQQQQTYYPTQ